MSSHQRNMLLLLIFLLIGAALRWYGQAEMQTILHGDEAFYGLDAISLIDNPRIEVYFPANTGREGLWMNLLAPMIALLGATPFVLRITSALVGILTIAAVYWLGRETLDEGAVWVAGALAVLYWHVQLSHIGFRVITLPLFGALAFASLLRAQRLNKHWWLAGLLLGLTLYTYIVARVYVGYAGLWLVWWFWREKSQRRGILIALAILILTSLPLLISLFFADGGESISRAAANDFGQIWQNLLNWGNAWLGRGDVSSTHNLPNRPVLDIPLAILALAGLAGVWVTIRQKWMIVWWVGLVVVSLLPTILSLETPHFLRGAGLLIPLVLLIGAGGAVSHRFKFGWIVPLMLLLWAGWNTYTDFGTWLETETNDFGITYDYRVNEAMFILDEATPKTQPIIMPSDDGFRATASYLAHGMNRDIMFYRWSENDCYLSPSVPYTVLDLPIVLNRFAERAVPYASDIETIISHPDNDYNIYTVTPSDDLSNTWQDVPQFGEFLSAQVINPTPSSVSAGETLTIYWAMRLEQALNRQDYRVLVHLQGDPTPYEGGTLYSTGDVPLCDLAYTAQALADNVTIIQQISLTIPDDLSARGYHVAMGFYEPDTFARLEVSPAENVHNYSNAWQVEVRE